MDKNNKQNKVRNFFSKHLIAVIDCVGCCIVVATFIPIFFVNTLWQSIFISISINIFTSLLVLTFVDRIIDSQHKREDEQKSKAIERGKILRIHKLVQQLLPNYIVEFNQITIPLKQRTGENGKYLPIDCHNFNSDFSIKDLIDFDTIDITVNGSFDEKAITSFQRIQDIVIEKLERMITEIEFYYYKDLEQSIVTVINSSRIANGIKQLELFSFKANAKIAKCIKEMIQKYNGNPIEDYMTGKFSGNALLHIINLYVYLINMRNCVNSYMAEIKKIENESI